MGTPNLRVDPFRDRERPGLKHLSRGRKRNRRDAVSKGDRTRQSSN